MDDSDSPKRKSRPHRPRFRWFRFYLVSLVIGLLMAASLAVASVVFPDPMGDLLAGAGAAGLSVVLLWLFVGLLWLSIRLTRAVVAALVRRRFQFSLRTLLLFVLLCAIPCSWFAAKVLPARRQGQAVAEVRKCGGSVSYSFGEPGDPFAEERPWLAKLLGDDWCPVVGVVLESQEVTDADLVHLKGLTNLQKLHLRETQITDAGLEHLKGLGSLEELYLGDTRITEAGLEHLKELTSLRRLDLTGTQITDAGLEHLRGFTNLVWLGLENTQITYQGVQHLSRGLPACNIATTHTPYLEPAPIPRPFPYDGGED